MILLRLLDVGFAGLGLLLLALPIALCGLLVRLGSPGPALFQQERVGQGEKRFVCIKLRTMSLGAPTGGTHDVPASMVTPIGRALRRTKLDELPQLWNVLVGDMSLVGPRPCLPMQTRLIEERRRRHVFTVRPGITGPGQVAGVDMSEPRRLAELDQQWAQGPKASAYFKFIALTLVGRGQGDRVGG